MFKKIVQPIYACYAVTILFVCFMAVYPFMRLCMFGNPVSGRKKLANMLRTCFNAWLFLIGMPLRFIGKKPSGSYVYVANHSSYLDTFSIAPATTGLFRVLGKAEMASIPFYGFVYKQMVITVDRKNPKNRALSMKRMWRQLQKEGSMVIFPEGTFNETPMPLKDFYDGAFRLAIISQKPIHPILFLDSAERWDPAAWWKFWPGKNRVVYLEPISVLGLKTGDTAKLKKQVYEIMENSLRKYKSGRYPNSIDNASI